MFGGKHGYVELASIANTNLFQTRTDEDEAFVLELEDYLDQNERRNNSHPDHNSRTDGISRDISKMSMKGYTDDPYLLQFNKDLSKYPKYENDALTPFQSSVTSFLGTPGSEGSSNYWSSSPENNSGLDETSTSTSSYYLLPNSYDSYQLSYDVNLSTTADQITTVPSSSLQGNSSNANKMFYTRKGDVNPSNNITGAVFHQLQPMNSTTENADVTIKVEIEDPYHDGMESVGQNQRSINDNPSIQIKKEIDEDELEMKPEVHVSMPCPICGMGETGTHNHYGGRACTSCRAFFRRSVQTNSYKSFKCQNTINKGVDQSGIKVETQPSDFNYYVKPKQFLPVQNVVNSKYHQQSSWGAFECRIDSRSWKSCRFCRFNKCIASGMRPGWVLTKEERILRQTKRTKNKNTVQKSNTSLTKLNDKTGPNACPNLSPIQTRLICPVMPNELKQIDQRQKCFMKLSTDNYIRYFVSRPQILMDVVQAQHYQKVLPYEAVQHLANALKVIIKEAMNCVRREEIGKDLPISDCLQLVENNASLVCNFSTSIKTCNKPRPKTSFEIIKASILKRIRSPKDDEERDQGAIIQSVYDALNIKPTEIDFTKIKMQYWQFFSSPWASSMEYEERHLELARQMSFWPILDKNACIMEEEVKHDKCESSLNKVEIIDDLQVYLMSAILAFSTDGIVSKLSRPDVVERIQEYYLTMLHRYLKYRYGEAEAMNRLARGMQITSMAREAKEICDSRLPI